MENELTFDKGSYRISKDSFWSI